MNARVPSMLAAAGLLVAGVVESVQRELSAALFSAGFIVLGVWLTLEIQAHRRNNKEATDE